MGSDFARCGEFRPRNRCDQPFCAPSVEEALYIRDTSVPAEFFNSALNFALFPDVPRAIQVASFGCETKPGAMSLTERQVRLVLSDPEWASLPLLESVLQIFGRAVRRMSRYRRPHTYIPGHRWDTVWSFVHSASEAA